MRRIISALLVLFFSLTLSVAVAETTRRRADTDNYRAFINSPINENSEYYVAAYVASLVIEDTLYNKESNLYGRIGREQYQKAVKYLCPEVVDTDSNAFKSYMKSIRRYFTEDSSKGIGNLYDDLVLHGFIDKKTGQMDTTIHKIAAKIGISQDAVYALFEEWNLFNEKENQLALR